MDWKKKLTSRKFWMAIAVFVVGVITLVNPQATNTQEISGLIMSLGSVVAYIVGEGLVDAAAVGVGPTVTIPNDPVVKAAGDIAAAAQAVKAVAEDVTKPNTEVVQTANSVDVKVSGDTAKVAEKPADESESASKDVTVIG